MKIGNREFDLKKNTYIMGILNVTPDSFFDGGKYEEEEIVLQHVKKMIDEGVDIIDIGGESTRPNYVKISDEEEIHRIVPIIKMIKNHFDIPISVDTYKSKVAKAAIEAGCDLINDIWGLKYDEKMAQVIRDGGVVCCLMHNRETMDYSHFMEDVFNDLKESIHIAKKEGIRDDRIILDPGVGFAKTVEQNLEVLARLNEFHVLGYPMLLGASRKSVIGKTLNEDVCHRLEGTLVTTVKAVFDDVSFVRVHDVLENKRAIEMSKAIKAQGGFNG